ncbi:hypothetical protein [Maribacter arenosus]|uniref:Uncharacterized protein n=1 Tax=Maribacter arenosus TaxID=1854708 RepID=A0ABR7VE58_9FLAO|nr:hypothetical protein [Maribacter arenosus]MBD0851930.1 hypothetical protein [Maribacter arenosus]
MKNETLLLTESTLSFRKEHPEMIQLWERQIVEDTCNPDLHFCLYALENYIHLRAQLIASDYLYDFVLNAHIVHADWQSIYVQNGHTDAEAVELANQEILQIYAAINKNPLSEKDKVVTEILDKESKQ